MQNVATSVKVFAKFKFSNNKFQFENSEIRNEGQNHCCRKETGWDWSNYQLKTPAYLNIYQCLLEIGTQFTENKKVYFFHFTTDTASQRQIQIILLFVIQKPLPEQTNCQLKHVAYEIFLEGGHRSNIRRPTL